MSKFIIELEQSIPALRRYAISLYHQQEEADDLVQDCLERALKKQTLWQKGTSLRAWLFTMQHNIFINQIRKKGRQPPMSFETDTLTHQLEPHQGEVLMQDIDRSMQQLPEEQKQVLLLVTIEGFTYKEVAKIVGIPVGTVMSRLSRAREALQTLMNQETKTSQPVLRSVK